MSFQKAIYQTSKNDDYKGNPYIEVLPSRLSAQDFFNFVVDEVDVPENISELDLETLEQKAANIMKSVSPTSLYYDVYCDTLNIIKEGYQERNPLAPETQKWQNQVANELYQKTRTTAPSLKFTGYSGMGKTTVIDCVLKLVPPVVEHPSDGPMEKNVLQIVYIKVDIPGEADSKEICLIIAREIDKVLGTDYHVQYEKLTRKRCINKLVTLCTTLLIGVIIFDEIHNICFSSPNERKLIFTLFDQITQVAKIPTIKIGTSKVNNLSEREFTNARRLGVPHEWRNFNKDDADWKGLVDYAWNYQLTKNYCELTSRLESKIYHITQGIPHCLFFLIEQANKYCIRYEINSFSEEILDAVFDKKFAIMKPALIALRHGKVDAFDDLMTVNSGLNREVSKLIKNVLKIAADNRLKGAEAKALYEQIEPYIPEYKFTKTEDNLIRQLEKGMANTPSKMQLDSYGYEHPPT